MNGAGRQKGKGKRKKVKRKEKIREAGKRTRR